MLGNIVSKITNKFNYPLKMKEFRGKTVFAAAVFKLDSGINTVYSLDFTDAYTRYPVPLLTDFSNNQLIESYYYKNRITNPAMNVDSGNGVCVGFSAANDANLTGVYTIDDNAQKVTASGGVSSGMAWVNPSPIITATAGELIEAYADLKCSGNVKGRLWVIFFNGATVLKATDVSETSSSNYVTLSKTGLIAPANTTHVHLRLGAMQNSAGAVGSAWVKNSSLVKVKTFIIKDLLNVNAGSGVPNGWESLNLPNNTAEFTIDTNFKAQKINLTATTDGAGALIRRTTPFAVTVGEIINTVVDCYVEAGMTATLYYDYLKDAAWQVASSVITSTVTGWVTITLSSAVPASPVGINKCQCILKIKSTAGNTLGAGYFRNLYTFRSNMTASVQQLNDQTGNGVNAIQNTLLTQPIVVNNGIYSTPMFFNSTPVNYLITPTSPSFQLTDKASIECIWIPTDLVQTSKCPFGILGDSTTYNMLLYQSGLNLVFFATTTNNNDTIDKPNFANGDPNKPVHAVGVFDRYAPDGLRRKLYINGVLVASHAGTNEPLKVLTNPKVAFGTWNNSSSMKCKIYKGALYNTALTQVEIIKLFNSSKKFVPYYDYLNVY